MNINILHKDTTHGKVWTIISRYLAWQKNKVIQKIFGIAKYDHPFLIYQKYAIHIGYCDLKLF